MLIIGFMILLAAFMGAGNALAISWTPDFSSSTHTVSSSSTNTSVTVSWSAMTPTGGSSADTYTYVWDNTNNTDISATKTPTETISGNLSGLTVTRTLTDGTWYFHARAVDSSGEWTITYHFGPIIIDATPAPTVTKIEPDTGVNSSDQINVTLTGTNFKKVDGSDFTSITVKIGTVSLTNVSVSSSTSLTATYAIKNKTADAYDVTVTTSYDTSEALSEGFTVTNPAPTVTSIAPTSASNAAEKSVTITGTGFLSTSTTPAGTASPTVQMRDPDNPSRNFSLTSVSVVSTTSITATVPASKTIGTYDVVVTNSDSQSAAKADAFEITAPAPTISSVSPDNGTNEKTTSITITGTNFQTSGTTTVTLEATDKETISCTSVSVSSATQITAVVPSGKAIATYDLKVTNPDAQSATKTSAFTVKYPVPTVTSISPDSMTNDASQTVTIIGTNFRTGATVKIGTTSASAVNLDGTTPETKLTCSVPADITPGTYDVSVTNVGTEAGTLSDGFEVTAATATVALSYSASDTDHVPAGSLTITATFSASQAAAPSISINQQGTTDITDQDMSSTADDKIWTYAYTVVADDGSTYVDGAATVTIKSSGGTSINITSGSSFTIDTAILSATVAYDQGGNTSGPFKAGGVTVAVTLSASEGAAPTISINQQGSTDITDAATSGSGTSWSYEYTVNAKDGSAYKDGTATVTLKTSGGTDIPIGSGGTFEIDTAGPSVALTYSQDSNTAGPFMPGAIAITAAFSETPAGTPQIAIDQPGSTDISAVDMSGSGRAWTYSYTINAADGSNYIDGDAVVAISNGADAAGNANAAATNSTFTIDTSATIAINAPTSPTDTTSQGITGTMESGATVAVSVTSPVAASTVTYPTSTTWACTISNLQVGTNSIDATATDAAGNTASASTSIEVAVVSSLSISQDSQNQCGLTWTASDGTYNVYYSESATASATQYTQQLGDDITDTVSEETYTYTDTTCASADTRFYLVKLKGTDISKMGVGMVKLSLSEGFNLVSCPLIRQDTDVNSVIGNQLTAGAVPTLADKIHLFAGTGYEWTYLKTDGGWSDWPSQAATTKTMTPDKGYWIEILSGHGVQDVYIVGSMPDDSYTFGISPGFNLVGNPYPFYIPLDSANFNYSASGGQAGAVPTIADKIHFFTGTGYEWSYLKSGDTTDTWSEWPSQEATTRVMETGDAVWIETLKDQAWTWTLYAP